MSLKAVASTSGSGGGGSTSSVITDDTTSNITAYPVWVVAASGSQPLYVSSTKFSINPSTGGITNTGGISAGNGQITGGQFTTNAATFRFSGSTRLDGGTTDGILTLYNAAQTGFTGLKLGGTTSSFPYLKVSGASVRLRLADDSADTAIIASDVTATRVLVGAGSRILSPTDGILELTDSTQTTFTRLQFGGTTSSFPSIKRSSAALVCRLADDSADATFGCGNLAVSLQVQFPGSARISSPSTNNIMLLDAAATSFGLLMFGGTTSSFPALKRTTTAINVRLADDSADADITAANITASAAISATTTVTAGTHLSAGGSSRIAWVNRSRILSPGDGTILLTNTAQTDFSLLQFGLSTSAAPAIKRNGAAINFRLADDSADAAITALSINLTSTTGIIGTTGASTAAAGSVGEIITNTIVQGSAIGLTNGTQTNITSISLTAGDWDVWGNVVFLTAVSTSYTLIAGGVSSTSATLPSSELRGSFSTAASVPGVALLSQGAPMQTLQLSGTTTIYLVALSNFTVSTMSGFGIITARRRR